MFAADAIGAHLVRSYAEAFEPVARHAPTSVEACAVMPSVTPVCFASMFTGAPPDTHGIRKSERPTLTRDTLCDALSRAGRRVAIVDRPHDSAERAGAGGWIGETIWNGEKLERATGVEPATSSLGSWHSTTELRPRRL